MKCLVFISIPLLLCSYKGYKKEEPCAKSELKGKVKTLTEWSERQGDTYQYDRSVYDYDRNGHLTTQRDSSYTRNRNERGGSGSVSVTSYSYKKGRLLRSVTNPEGVRSMVQEYLYDKKGKLLTIVKYAQRDAGRDTAMLTLVSYSDKGSVREITYINKGKETGRERELYDAKGNLAEDQVYDRKEHRFLTTDKRGYDSEGNMRYKEVYDLYKESAQYTIRYQFANGQLAGETWEGADSREIKYSWSEPDAKGNYLVKTIERKPAPADVVRRSIVYY